MGETLIAERDTDHSHLSIVERPDPYTNRPMRELRIGTQYSSAMYLDGPGLAYKYTRWFRLVGHFVPNPRRVLAIGGAAYSYPKDFLESHPQGEIDVVEIDPGITAAAHEFFNLPDNPNLHIHHAEGRAFIEASPPATYDAVFIDAFTAGEFIPMQLADSGSVQAIKRTLKPGGVAFMNIIGSTEGGYSEQVWELYQYYSAAFPYVLLFLVQEPKRPEKRQNVVLVACTGERVPILVSQNPEFTSYLDHWYEV